MFPKELVEKQLGSAFNDILTPLKLKNCEWKSDEVHSGIATKSILCLSDAVWYVDNSHSI